MFRFTTKYFIYIFLYQHVSTDYINNIIRLDLEAREIFEAENRSGKVGNGSVLMVTQLQLLYVGYYQRSLR